MSYLDFEKTLRQTRFDFSENQLITLKNSCTELYRVLKFVFDSPKKLQKPYTSLEEYRFRKERMYQSPSDFYHYRDNEVEIKLWKRLGRFYSVAVYGNFTPQGINFDAFIGHEKEFSQGFMFYGKFLQKEFSKAIDVFNYTVKQYIQKKQDDVSLF